MITTLAEIERRRWEGLRPAGWVYVSLMGEVRLPQWCVLIHETTDIRKLDMRCLAGGDVIVVTPFPISNRALDVVDRAIYGCVQNIAALDPISKSRIGIVYRGKKSFTVQEFQWGDACITSKTT